LRALAIISVVAGAVAGLVVPAFNLLEGLCGGVLLAFVFCGIDGGSYDEAKPYSPAK
jgi:ABC-type transporter Mla maintaining outer membrane lipid asymmetry permease subunit MlaE